MSSFPLPAAILLGLALPIGGAPDAPVQVAQLTIHQRIVIRFPRLPEPREPAAAVSLADPAMTVEKKGPKCVAIPSIQGASVTRGDSVDLVMDDGVILRTHFDGRCPALDFYQGFYMRPSGDGQVCAGRDSLRARSGGNCRIKSFKRLVPKR
jgi:hypothetical protein